MLDKCKSACLSNPSSLINTLSLFRTRLTEQQTCGLDGKEGKDLCLLVKFVK